MFTSKSAIKDAKIIDDLLNDNDIKKINTIIGQLGDLLEGKSKLLSAIALSIVLCSQVSNSEQLAGIMAYAILECDSDE